MKTIGSRIDIYSGDEWRGPVIDEDAPRVTDPSGNAPDAYLDLTPTQATDDETEWFDDWFSRLLVAFGVFR